MTAFVKIHFPKIIYASLGALLMWAFALGTIWKEHANLLLDVETLKNREESIREKQGQLVMNDSLLSVRLNDVVKNQNTMAMDIKRSNRVLNRIANKLHVEIPVE